jgi:dihydrofolate reductase
MGLGLSEVSVEHVVATTKGGAIGNAGKLLWHIPEDLLLFKSVTMGGVMLMGRRTFESIGFVLPGRHSIVLTRNMEWAPGDHAKNWDPKKSDSVHVCDDLDAAVAKYKQLVTLSDSEDQVPVNAAKLFCIGGGEIYKLTQPICSQVHWSLVGSRSDANWEPEADTHYDMGFLELFDAQECRVLETTGDYSVKYSQLIKKPL